MLYVAEFPPIQETLFKTSSFTFIVISNIIKLDSSM